MSKPYPTDAPVMTASDGQAHPAAQPNPARFGAARLGPQISKLKASRQCKDVVCAVPVPAPVPVPVPSCPVLSCPVLCWLLLSCPVMPSLVPSPAPCPVRRHVPYLVHCPVRMSLPISCPTLVIPPVQFPHMLTVPGPSHVLAPCAVLSEPKMA